jgi:acyl-homoserine-lactone acylase
VPSRLLLLTLVVACGTPQPAQPQQQPPAKTEILWDTFGVPHIYGRTSDELFRAVGWAQMEAHGDLILRLYAQARGRAAEYLGEPLLGSDRMVHTLGIPDLARTWWTAQSPRARAATVAYVAGINDWTARHRDRVPAPLAAMLPIEPVDVIAHSLRAIHFTFVVGEDDTAERWRGSNAWAIAPSDSASGRAMLLANPHLPWGDLFTWFEMHLVGPDFDAYGAAFVGTSTIGIGWNRHLAWTHTVNTIDAADYFELTLAPGGYLLDGKVVAFEQQQHTLRVRTAAGLRDEPITVTRSRHGPVVAIKEKAGKALALRVAGLDRTALVDERLDMMRARNLGELETALRQLQFPMFTVMYADRDGHIMHLFNGTVPVRPAGSTFERTAGIVPGDRSDAIWTTYLPYDQLPRVVDPPSGWLQNANDPPWTTTFPAPPTLDPARYPSYIAPRGMELRPQRSARMLLEDKDKVTFDELVRYKHSTRMELADRVLDELVTMARAHGSDRARRAASVLVGWDRTADVASRGGVLFEAFANALRKRGRMWRVPWSAAKPLETPAGLADEATALAALDEAAQLVETRHGRLDVAWGDVHRLRWAGRDYPCNGAPGSLGVFRAVGYAPDKDAPTRSAVGGDSFVAAVELGPEVRARVLVVYGNSSREGSPHRTDQLELFSKQQLRDAWQTRAEVEAHLERREAF